MTALATTEDLEARLGRELTVLELVRAEALLADASGSVILYTGQEFVESETTATFAIRRGVIRLPQRPVTEVASVEDSDSNALTYQWDEGTDRIDVSAQVPNTFAWVPYRNPLRRATVTYTHGYTLIPDAVIGVVCSIVLRALGQSATDAGITQESIDGYSYSRGTIAAAGAFGLLPDEKATLDVYRRVGGTIEVDR